MIEVRGIRRSFAEKPVLRGVDLSIATGESITIIGQSGCGKSVLLKHLVGLLVPDEGTITVDGHAITGAPRKELYEIRKKFGVLFQGAALFDSMTVAENVSLGLRQHTEMSEAQIALRVRECLTMVSMEGTQKLKPAELSGGMKKRVGLARAIAMQPSYILYDEPTTGLDPITADSINDLILHLNEKLNVTTIVVTHDMVSAYKISDRIVMLHEGRVIFSGSPDETKNAKLDIVRRFVTGEADEQPYVITSY
ncbi:ABC transporter ATP-binding protein [bacterium]|nr:ABC transporter ATP-binding protein [bacterium]MBU1984330.1 ABC transporter ATP-binding protein [bacterium]